MVGSAGSAEKVAACREFGAAEAWNYREQDFAEEVKRLTDGKGIDAILDTRKSLESNVAPLLAVETMLIAISGVDKTLGGGVTRPSSAGPAHSWRAHPHRSAPHRSAGPQ